MEITEIETIIGQPAISDGDYVKLLEERLESLARLAARAVTYLESEQVTKACAGMVIPPARTAKQIRDLINSWE